MAGRRPPIGNALALRPPDAGHSVVPQHVRDDYLPPGALELVLKGIPKNTWLAYRAQLVKFAAWCEANGRTFAPVTQNTMLAYLSYLAHQEARPAPPTIWVWYSAVRWYHGMGEPPLPWECGKKLSLAIDGYTSEMIEAGWSPRSAPRAYPEYVRKMVDCCDREFPSGIRDAALILTNWWTAARASDLATYRIHDVTFTPGGVDMLLRKSKNLKRGATRTMAMFRNEQFPAYCPEAAMRAWLDFLAAQGIRTGALFRPIDKHGRIRASAAHPSFEMNHVSVSGVIQKYGKMAGLGDNFSCHSLRRGLATWLRELGRDPLEIARGYGWSPQGRSINVYLEEAYRWSERAPAAGVLLGVQG